MQGQHSRARGLSLRSVILAPWLSIAAVFVVTTHTVTHPGAWLLVVPRTQLNASTTHRRTRSRNTGSSSSLSWRSSTVTFALPPDSSCGAWVLYRLPSLSTSEYLSIHRSDNVA
eukprot:COSAG01_NODE_416_length_17299_cov_62.219186_5_plen_114_part_00